MQDILLISCSICFLALSSPGRYAWVVIFCVTCGFFFCASVGYSFFFPFLWQVIVSVEYVFFCFKNKLKTTEFFERSGRVKDDSSSV